jgi:hypothetical protein
MTAILFLTPLVLIIWAVIATKDDEPGTRYSSDDMPSDYF